MSRHKRGESYVTDNIPPLTQVQKDYLTALGDLGEILPAENLGRIVERWEGDTYEQKLERAENLLRWEEQQPGWLFRAYGPK